tara:strand:- start:86391 stop:87347 length:957 start_codon:yes stop_codon:yes gene_type:complete
MKLYYLPFEKDLEDLDNRILNVESIADKSPEMIEDLNTLKKERSKQIKNIYPNLTSWQRVQLARHPNRPYSLDYIKYFSTDFIELHGDRHFMDDPAVVAGLGYLGGKKIAWVGQQKGRSTKENLKRNFGMMRPEGYRKALRIMRLAEKFNLPIVTFIDTMGAYPGIGAEERGQGEAIARNLIEMSSIEVPIIGAVIGEGASGGALGIGLCDWFLMMENTWYSVISPEGCASILYHDASKAESAAESLKLIPDDLRKLGICDDIVPEPEGGAHRNFEESAKSLKTAVLNGLEKFSKYTPNQLMENRIEKYNKLGYFKET